MTMALVQVNDAGRRIGERHPAAVLSDAEVEQLLAMKSIRDTKP